MIDNPNSISDRMNDDKFVDDYLEKFKEEQKSKIEQAKDGFLIGLETFDEDDLIENLMEILFYKRQLPDEEFLFDKKIPILKNQTLTIHGWIQKDNKDFRRLSQQGYIDKGLHIRFEVFMPIKCDHYKWRVRNDDSSPQPRGEITDHQTKNNPESTKYKGSHYVECYAISNNICIASARQNVIVLH